MQRYYQATGGLEEHKKINSSYSEGKIRLDGLTGTFRHWEQSPLKYRTEEDYTTISHIAGDTGTVNWLLDTNGQLIINRDNDTLKRRKIAKRLERYEHLNKNSPYFSFSKATITTINGTPCYSLSLSNTINSDITTFYIDTKTFLLVQSVHKHPDVEMRTSYSDYRWVGKIQHPFFNQTYYTPIEKKEETQLTKILINEPIAPQLFSLPDRVQDFKFTTHKKSSSARFVFAENLIYLPVTLKGSEKYWVLDSGASMSVIDLDYAKELGLRGKGTIKGYGFGELFDLSFVDIPGYQLGNIIFEPQTVYGVKDLKERSYEPEIAGILGYDFLSRFVVEIDYSQQIVTFHSPEAFHFSGHGQVIDAPLKYRTFSIPVEIEGKYKGNWSLDLGAHMSSIHYQFAENHRLLERQGTETISQGISGIAYEKMVEFGSLSIGGFQLDNHLLTIPLEKGKGTTALGEVAGNLGNSTLRHFHLILNYPKQQIVLSKNKNFNSRFPRDRSGMLIGRSESNQPMVSFVATNSPAHKAGLIAGDIILKIDGKTISQGHPVLALRNLLRGSDVEGRTITVSREHLIIDVSLRLENLFPPD